MTILNQFRLTDRAQDDAATRSHGQQAMAGNREGACQEAAIVIAG
jgi:hypothetical protein